MKDFASNQLFSYNNTYKFWEGIAKIGFGIIFFAFLAAYFLNAFEGTIITTTIEYIKNQIASNTLQGLFILATIGGVFFLPVPLDPLFLRSVLDAQYPWLNFTIMLIGLILSQSLNYLLGAALSRFAIKMIPAEKFYAIKVKLNQYGKTAIFLFNVLPLLPAQPLMFVCGVFRYNKTRLAVIWIFAWVIKLAIYTQFTSIIANYI
jgi:membrane protein YqaA with SNARE-associated domain